MATSNYVMPTYPKFPGYEETEKKDSENGA